MNERRHLWRRFFMDLSHFMHDARTDDTQFRLLPFASVCESFLWAKFRLRILRSVRAPTRPVTFTILVNLADSPMSILTDRPRCHDERAGPDSLRKK